MYHDDNVAFHHCAEVAAAFEVEEDGFFLDFLPSNMTDKLQPMDVAINNTAERRCLLQENAYTKQ